MRIEAVIFDKDGLMFDTERLVEESWIAYGKEQGYPIDKAFMCRIRGRNAASIAQVVKETLGEAFPFEDAKKTCYEDIMRVMQTEGLPVKNGLRELLRQLKTAEFPMAVATSTARPRTMLYLEHVGITDYFDTVICGDMVQKSKPDPEIFFAAAKKLGKPAEKCLILEDSPNGVRAATRAGASVFMIPDMDAPTEEIASLANRVLPSLKEVFQELQSMNKE